MAQVKEVKTETSNAQRPTPNVQLAEGGGLSTLNSQPSTWLRLFWRALAIIIGGLFIYAGAIKALDPIHFGLEIDSYKMVPWAIGVRFAFFLPWLEILSGLALVTRRLYLGGLSILTALILVFIGATLAVKVRGLDIDCACFGHLSDNLSFTWHLVLNFAILAGLSALFFVHRKSMAAPSASS